MFVDLKSIFALKNIENLNFSHVLKDTISRFNN